MRGRWRVSRERHVHAGRSRVPARTRRQPSERDPAHRGRSGRVSLGHGGRVPQRADRHPRSTAFDTQPRSPLGLRHRLPDRAQHGLLVLPLARLHAHRSLRPELRRRVAHRGPPDHHSEGAAVARRHRRRAGRPVQRRQRRGRLLHVPRRQVRRIRGGPRLRRRREGPPPRADDVRARRGWLPAALRLGGVDHVRADHDLQHGGPVRVPREPDDPHPDRGHRKSVDEAQYNAALPGGAAHPAPAPSCRPETRLPRGSDAAGVRRSVRSATTAGSSRAGGLRVQRVQLRHRARVLRQHVVDGRRHSRGASLPGERRGAALHRQLRPGPLRRDEPGELPGDLGVIGLAGSGTQHGPHLSHRQRLVPAQLEARLHRERYRTRRCSGPAPRRRFRAGSHGQTPPPVHEVAELAHSTDVPPPRRAMRSPPRARSRARWRRTDALRRPRPGLSRRAVPAARSHRCATRSAVTRRSAPPRLPSCAIS